MAHQYISDPSGYMKMNVPTFSDGKNDTFAVNGAGHGYNRSQDHWLFVSSQGPEKRQIKTLSVSDM